MSEWIKAADRLSARFQHVDLWIKGDRNLISFYDPGRGTRATEGRTPNWVWDGNRWKCSEGLTLYLSPEAEVTHWMPIPEPPK